MSRGQITNDSDADLAVGRRGMGAERREPNLPLLRRCPPSGRKILPPPVSENPPISAIDQPGLEPHAAPESFLLPGTAFQRVGGFQRGEHGGRVVDQLGHAGFGKPDLAKALEKLRRSHGLHRWSGLLCSQRRWVRAIATIRHRQSNQLEARPVGRCEIRSVICRKEPSASPPTAEVGLTTSGWAAWAPACWGRAHSAGRADAFTAGEGVSVGQVPRLTNLGLADVVENLTPKSSVDAGRGLRDRTHFYGASVSHRAVRTTTFPLSVAVKPRRR